MRLHHIEPEYKDRVRLRTRAFPLEITGTKGVPRDILEQEWWLAAIQEPKAEFKRYTSDDWPTSTLPAFEAVWCATQQGEDIGRDFDLRVRHAFFAECRNIGRREVLFDLARDAGLHLDDFRRAFDSGAARAAVLEEHRVGREQYRVRGTPTLMLRDGTRLRHPIAFPIVREHRIVGVTPLPCCGEGCLETTRALFEKALRQA